MQKTTEQAEGGVYVDRRFTIQVTIASLLAGVVMAAVVGLLLLSLAQVQVVPERDQPITFSLGQLLLPISAVSAAAILYWAVFNLPIRIAKRRGITLDPDIYPFLGAVLVAGICVAGFIAAMVLGVI
jgi:hypothetical protein